MLASMLRTKAFAPHVYAAGLKGWYGGLPPISRTYLTIVLVTLVACFPLGVVPMGWIHLAWKRVLTKFEVRANVQNAQ